MNYTIRGTLDAEAPAEVNGPVGDAMVRLYATNGGVDPFAVVDAATVSSRASDLLGEGATDAQGAFSVDVTDTDYVGEAVEVHVRSADLPGGTASAPTQAIVAVFQPRWRGTESGLVATFEYTFSRDANGTLGPPPEPAPTPAPVSGDWIIQGSLSGMLADGTTEPLGGATVRLYRLPASGDSSFALLDEAAVTAATSRLLTETLTAADGGFGLGLDTGADDYDGETVVVHVRVTGSDGVTRQARLTRFQPRWRQRESGLYATWSYTIPADDLGRLRGEGSGAGGSRSGSVGEDLGEGGLTLGVLSTPAANVLGRSVNPIAGIETDALLTSPEAASFLRASGVEGGGSLDWLRGPDPLGTTGTTLLDESVTLETFGGILDGSPARVVYVHLVRLDGESVVITAGVHGDDVTDTGRPLVGADGYLTQGELDDRRAAVADANAELTVR